MANTRNLFDDPHKIIEPANSFCDEIMINKHPDLKYSLFYPIDKDTSHEEPNHVEYLQCTPSPSTVMEQRNPFQAVIDSMQKYSKSKSMKTLPKKSRFEDEEKNQTIFCKHESNRGDQNYGNNAIQKTYRSHTTIEAIPNGLRIITDILREENDEDDKENPAENYNGSTQTKDDWMNQKLEVTVEADEESD